MPKTDADSKEEKDLDKGQLDTEVETDDESEDETAEQEDQEESQDSDQDEETDEAADDDESDAADEDDSFKKRFTQFEGDDPTTYSKNLEDGYENSSKEAVRLSRENKALKATVDKVNELIAKNPELAKAITDGTPATNTATTLTQQDPAILWAQTQMRQTWEKEYKDFASEHPDIETDVELAEALDTKLAIVRDVVLASEKRQVGMGEGLEMAWKLLGKTDDKQEKIRMAAKDSASQGKSQGGRKADAPKPKFSEAQISVAMDMLNVSREEAIKQLSTHNT